MASDGGDIGCRYTPEMIELCKQALDLRRRGILKFQPLECGDSSPLFVDGQRMAAYGVNS